MGRDEERNMLLQHDFATFDAEHEDAALHLTFSYLFTPLQTANALPTLMVSREEWAEVS